MDLKNDFKTELNKLIADKTADIKKLFKKFSVGEQPTTPVAQAAPPVQPQATAAPTTPVAQSQETTTADGTVIKYNTPTLEVGSMVTVVSEQGELPAPSGEHKLADGTTIVIGEGGIVESITPAVTAPVAQAQAPAQPSVNLQPILNQMAALEAKFKAEKSEKEQIKKDFDAFKKEITEDFKAFLTIMQPFLDAPSAEPAEKPKNKFEKKGSVLNKLINQ